MKRMAIGGMVLALVLGLAGCTATYGPDFDGDGYYYGPEWNGALIVNDGYYHRYHDYHRDYHPPVFYPGGGHRVGGWGGDRGRASLGSRAGHAGFHGGGHPAAAGHPSGGGRGGHR